jgi:hypothetical protein
VLGWLRSVHRRYTSFVSHRIGEILDSTSVGDWRWIPGKLNVADDGTKWEGSPTILTRWLDGPLFLQLPETEWPIEKNRITSTKEEEHATQFHLNHRVAHAEYDSILVERFSQWKRLVRAVAYCRRYIGTLKQRVKAIPISVVARVNNIETLMSKITALNGDELDAATRLLIKKSQLESFSDDLHELKAGKSVPRNSRVFNLSPVLDSHGILRVNTRLDAAPAFISEDTKHPILLSGDHPITILIMEDIHKRLHHRNREAVISELRQRLWIPRIRVHVNKIFKRCPLCAVLKAKPNIPQMSQLPSQRLEPFSPPFTNTGIDYAGPFEVTVGRRHEKRWIVLFTCLTMRAIHLEVASTLTTSSCIMSIRNFMNRRGIPKEIISDNGTNLRGAERELGQLLVGLNQETIISETQPTSAVSHNIQWKFITPAAPHFGGVWERMIRLTKDSLYQTLKSRAPKDEVFRSAVVEVEATVNSRPLYYTSTHDIDSPAVTPNTLLHLSLSNGPYPVNPDELPSRKQWVTVQEIAHEFWRRWLKHYLPTIAIRQKWFDDTIPLKPGQLVLIIDGNIKRGDWKRGIVVEAHKSRDGKVRSATVKTATGVLRRPAVKLAVIKIAT